MSVSSSPSNNHKRGITKLIRGYVHQGSYELGNADGDNYTVCICCLVLIFKLQKFISNWGRYDVDTVVIAGIKAHKEMGQWPTATMHAIGQCELPVNFKHKGNSYHFTYLVTFSGGPSKGDRSVILQELTEAIQAGFKISATCLFIVDGYATLLIKSKAAVVMFESRSCDSKGRLSPSGDEAAVLVFFKELEPLLNTLLQNMDLQSFYEVVPCKVQREEVNCVAGKNQADLMVLKSDTVPLVNSTYEHYDMLQLPLLRGESEITTECSSQPWKQHERRPIQKLKKTLPKPQTSTAFPKITRMGNKGKQIHKVQEVLPIGKVYFVPRSGDLSEVVIFRDTGPDAKMEVIKSLSSNTGPRNTGSMQRTQSCSNSGSQSVTMVSESTGPQSMAEMILGAGTQFIADIIRRTGPQSTMDMASVSESQRIPLGAGDITPESYKSIVSSIKAPSTTEVACDTVSTSEVAFPTDTGPKSKMSSKVVVQDGPLIMDCEDTDYKPLRGKYADIQRRRDIVNLKPPYGAVKIKEEVTPGVGSQLDATDLEYPMLEADIPNLVMKCEEGDMNDVLDRMKMETDEVETIVCAEHIIGKEAPESPTQSASGGETIGGYTARHLYY